MKVKGWIYIILIIASTYPTTYLMLIITDGMCLCVEL